MSVITRQDHDQRLRAAIAGAQQARQALVDLQFASPVEWRFIRDGVNNAQRGFERVKPLLELTDAEIADAVARSIFAGAVAGDLRAAIVAAQQAGAAVIGAIVMSAPITPVWAFDTTTGLFAETQPVTPDAQIADARALIPAAVAAIDAVLGS